MTYARRLDKMIKGRELRKAGSSVEQILLDPGRRGRCRAKRISKRIVRLFEGAEILGGAVFFQYSAMARSLCASRHGTLADFLRSARRREQGVGKEAAFLVVFISRRNFDHNDEPSVTHFVRLRPAWENFALQGFHQGLVVHGMEGIRLRRAPVRN